jgi:pimeloyl-ACP methyl ester carboxylesterase
MPQVTTRDGAEIFYKDWGSGQALVFHHGWPLSADDWDAQMLFSTARATASSPTIGADTGGRARPPAGTK